MKIDDYQFLVGKYLNGYKIVKVDKDHFIPGQINLWTDEIKVQTFGDRSVVKFFLRNEGNTSKIYQELVDKENYELKQALNEIRDKLLSYGETFDSDIHKQFQRECLQIIEKYRKEDDNLE